MKEIRIGLFGNNGHQLQKDHVLPLQNASVTAAYGIEPEALASLPGIRFHEDYAALCNDPDIDLISICSPIRALQYEAIIAALHAGKHVYAEKPAVLNLPQLNQVLTAAKLFNREFFEMAGTSFDEPYKTAGRFIGSGMLGEVVQITVQKSYPYADWRPQDEALDGGLIMQVGIHAVRLIEHTACQKVAAVSAIQTGLGNPGSGELQMSSSWNLMLDNGGLASVTAHYLNQPAFGSWGNESLKVYGTDGFLETEPLEKTIRLVTREKSEIIHTGESDSYLQAVVNYLLGHSSRPFTPEDELHPLRVVIAARASAACEGALVEVI